MRNLKLALALAASLIVLACPALAQNEFKTPTQGKTVVGFQVLCQNSSGQAVTCGDASNPLQIAGTFSAALGGFTPSLSGARGTPITVTVADSSGTLPTGTVVDVSNVGSNPMYCNVNGVPATTADKLIAANSWFEFTIPAGGTLLHCIATGGSTTANMVGGSGLGTGAGGGSSGGGSGGNVNLTQIAGAAPSLTNPLWVSPATGATFPVSGTVTVSGLGSPFQAGGSIGNTTFAATQATASALNATVVGTGTFAVQLTGATNNINNIAGTITLPTGASTSALQITGNTSLASIAANTGAVISTGTGWTSATSVNSTQILMTAGLGYSALTVQLKQTSTLTGGVVTFEGTYDGTFTDNTGGVAYPIPVSQIINPLGLAPLSNPYTLVASTNQPFVILTQGMQSIRMRLSTAITGTATVTPVITLWPNNPAVNGILSSLVPGTAIVGKFGVDQSNPGVSNAVQNIAGATGGTASCQLLVATASTNSTNCKGSAATVYEFSVVQSTTTLGDLRLYDSASAPTCSSATGLIGNWPVQSSATSPGMSITFGPAGRALANGLGFCFTGAVANNDNTNWGGTASGVAINIGYK